MQLKSRLSFDKKYIGKDLHIAFAGGDVWYLYPHDELLEKVLKLPKSPIANTESWTVGGRYSFPRISKELQLLLDDYRVAGSTKPIPE